MAKVEWWTNPGRRHGAFSKPERKHSRQCHWPEAWIYRELKALSRDWGSLRSFRAAELPGGRRAISRTFVDLTNRPE
jgi:hypothetical protein